MKKILVPTDFSECAENAAEVAANLARKTGARLYVLHILDIPVYERNDSFQSYVDTAEGIFWMKLVKKRFKELFAKPFMKGVNAVEVLQFDGVYDTIASQAKEHEIDLIVMGSHGDSGIHEVFIGSNTEKVVRIAPCPVLTVKHRHENFNLKRVMFASNFFGEAKDNFTKLFNFIRLFDAHIDLVKVITPDQFETTAYSEKLMLDFASEWKLKKYDIHIFNDRTVPDGILAAADKLKADAIAMETHGRTGIGRFFFGSHTETVVNHANVPVLSVRIEEIKKEHKSIIDLSV
ncbi:MAG: universal stress protein [Salibacteraceae bacterium]